MTPSAFMQVQKVRGMSSDPDIGTPASLEGPDPKTSQADANYGGSDAKCRTCEFFDGTDACSKVEGVIDPEGHSRFYSRDTQSGPEIEEENEGEYDAE